MSSCRHFHATHRPQHTQRPHAQTHTDMDFASFLHFSQLIATCSQASRKIHEKLVGSTSEIIVGLMKGVSSPEKYCFRIPMGSGRFTHLSVSVPPDAMGNRGPPQDSSTVPKCIETALVGPDGNLVYIDGLEYSDICRFYGDTNFEEAIPSLEAEILRLLPYAQGKKQIPEEGSSSESETESESESEVEEEETHM